MNLEKKRNRDSIDLKNNVEKQKEKEESPNFLIKLNQILENPKFYDIIHWDNSGKYLIISNISKFSEIILPLYYKHNNYSSFVRQLNIYDFHKLKSENGKQVFQHRLFTRGKSNLIPLIKRKTTKIKNENIAVKEILNTKIQDNYLDDLINELNTNKKVTKQSLEENLNTLIKQVNENKEKQNSLLKKVDNLNKQNKNFIEQNELMLNEINKKTQYTRKLEAVILFILEILMNKRTDINKSDNNINNFDFQQTIIPSNGGIIPYQSNSLNCNLYPTENNSCFNSNDSINGNFLQNISDDYFNSQYMKSKSLSDDNNILYNNINSNNNENEIINSRNTTNNFINKNNGKN